MSNGYEIGVRFHAPLTAVVLVNSNVPLPLAAPASPPIPNAAALPEGVKSEPSTVPTASPQEHEAEVAPASPTALWKAEVNRRLQEERTTILNMLDNVTGAAR